jgi:GAF domain-containing protein
VNPESSAQALDRIAAMACRLLDAPVVLVNLVGSDPGLAADPVVEQLDVRAYGGVPLRAVDGEPVGTLCAIDLKPHEWSEDDIALLSDLAASAMAELQLLAATRRVARQQSRVRTLSELSTALVPASSAEDRDYLAAIAGLSGLA